VFVIAGPGTGKTQVLTLRIANILAKTDTPPEAILALTFTDSGADEMRQRLARFIGSRAAKVRFHTFHAFAQNLINQHPEHFTQILGAQIASDVERAEIIEQAILTAEVEYLRPVNKPMTNHYAVGRAIQTLKRENVTPEILAQIVADEQAKFDAIPNKESTRSKKAGVLQGKYITLQKKKCIKSMKNFCQSIIDLIMTI
jgi:DNA helicase-2/ATP-dependent DNA helicase PcrA